MSQNRSALNYSLWLLGKRDYSTYKIVEKLKQKKYPPEEVAQALKKLRELGFLDDKKYAKRLTDNFHLRGGIGGRLIYQKLLQKGISKEIIKEVLGDDEEENIKEAISRWLKKRPQNEALERQKLLYYLSRRGYEYDSIIEAVKKHFEP